MNRTTTICRILRKIAENQVDQIGDTTTLADAHVVETLVKGKQQTSAAWARREWRRHE